MKRMIDEICEGIAKKSPEEDIELFREFLTDLATEYPQFFGHYPVDYWIEFYTKEGE